MKIKLSNGIVVIAGQLIVAGTGLATVRILTEYLQPTEYGMLTLSITFTLMANQVIFGPLSAGLTRFFSAADELVESEAIIKAAYTLSIYAVAILIGMATIAVAVLAMIGSYRWATLIGLAVIYSITLGFYSFNNGILLAKNEQKKLTIFQCFEPLARLVFAFLLIYFFNLTAEMALTGFLLGALIIVFIQIMQIKDNHVFNNNVDSEIKVKWREKILRYGAPYATWGIFTTINLASDRWVLHWTQSQEQVGLYSALYQIGYLPMIMLVSIFSQLITPYLYKTAGDGTDSARLLEVYPVINKAVAACLFATLIISIFGFFYHEIIYAQFVSKEYAKISIYLPHMILAAGIFASAQVKSLRLHSSASTVQLIPIKVGIALIGIILNIILGSQYGVFGIVIAQLLTSITYLTWISCIGPKL